MTKRILIISASPWDKDMKRLGVNEEYRTIKEVWEKSGSRDHYEIEHSSATRPDDFQAEILKFKPHVVHFSVHGKQDALAFQGNDDKAQWIRQDALVNLFESLASQVECVIMNACRTETLAEAINRHIDYVVGMEKAIGDIAAEKFSKGFYTALFAGKFYPAAYKHGCIEIQFANIPEHLTPKLKIKDKARRQNYVPGYGSDICVLFAEHQAEWAKLLAANLDDLLSQKFGHRNIHTMSLVSDAGVECQEICRHAATLLVVLSKDFRSSSACQNASDAFANAAKDSSRVFLLETDSVPCHESLQKSWKYRFWQPGSSDLLSAGDSRYNDQLNLLASELSDKLRKMKQNAEHRQKIAAEKEKRGIRLDEKLPPDLLFVNAATEDEDLLKQIISFLDENQAQYILPLDPSSNPTPEEIRRDLEDNLITCDLFLLIYGKIHTKWVREQVNYCHRMQRKRERDNPIRLIVVHNEKTDGDKPPLKMNFHNLRVYDCPPSDIAEYLPKCMGDACQKFGGD